MAERKNLSVLILSGSPIIGSFDFRARVDFVRIPGVIKLRNGEYSSLSLHMDIAEVMELREEILRHTARVFRPDVLIVDKEPLGLRGEMLATLDAQKRAGTHLVLGLRDVMDDPEALATEWARKNPVPALTDLYDAIWVYGQPQICDPLAGVDMPDTVREKMSYTGYLRRALPEYGPGYTVSEMAQEPYILVMTGGGGDGEELIDWVLRAYEADPDIPHRALMVFGPFMAPSQREMFRRRLEPLDRVEALTFDARVEHLIDGAVGVVAMGGYNTFCEILSFDKRAVVVPRRVPRKEQWIRTAAAEDLGLVRMLSDEHGADTQAMVAALRGLPDQALPSTVMAPGMLDGLGRIQELVEDALARGQMAARASA